MTVGPEAVVTACIGIGGNLGDALATVSNAIQELAQLPHSTVIAQSPLYRSAPIEASGDDYVNAVLALQTTLTPYELLNALQALEQTYGRQRPYRNAPRTLDLDILLYGDAIIDDARLSVPHPRMTQRAFVLIPLLDIFPEIVIPGMGAALTWRTGVANQIIHLLTN